MKLRILCVKCPTRHVDELLFAEQRDDGLYRVTCPKAHESVVWLQNHKFEMLLDSGAMALLDGYPREAVSSIAASFERFLEFYIRVIVRKQGISPETLDSTWKLVSNQSERQIGSFLVAFLLENRRSPDFLERRWIEFRNKVIHRGYIPSTQEAKAYGERIFQFIKGLLNDLRANSQDAIFLITAEMNSRASQEHPGIPFAIHVIPTIISTLYPLDEGPQSFEEGLEHVRQVKPRAYGL